ncbi:DNA-binding transcriptional LysR family regulator [Luteibacter rhizovicinus]|uniref:DNA-binding transcriptional LysR family regulator n=1 Tax=Luteibacter rhizovicinus TaxID=242606 RepID=A0A4R3YYY5_9GAMM|nr:LysR substrate-binding domain-containing protein [Luteibacter rhizovicinus]TCV97088.1 DNA-binding transcriptional LysR family regulator [Luteibacter rhizovicinus]
MDLHALADFNAVVAHGGFGKASRATGRPKASLSRRIMQLEQELGVRLFERGSRILVLTEEGMALRETTMRQLDELEAATHAISTRSQRPTGRLRVSAPSAVAYEALGELAATYIARYPEVRLEVIAEDRFVDLIAEDFDIVIRANPAPDTDLAGRCFFRDTFVVVAAPAVGMLYPEPARREGHPVPAVMLPGGGNSAWRLANDRIVNVTPVVRLSSISMIHDAALAGAGAAVLPYSRAQADIAAGRLENWGALEGRGVEAWALYATRRLLSRKISAFIDLLVESYEGKTSDYQSVGR